MSDKSKQAAEFLKGSREELRKVNWPTRKETIRLTTFVVVCSLMMAAFLGILDIVFIRILEQII